MGPPLSGIVRHHAFEPLSVIDVHGWIIIATFEKVWRDLDFGVAPLPAPTGTPARPYRPRRTALHER